MPKIPGINHLDAVRALQKAGFRIVRQSKHIVMSDGVRIVTIPRMGRRNDVVLLIASALFVLEFKIGERQFASHAINQAYDYALDLKNFHETGRDLFIAGI